MATLISCIAVDCSRAPTAMSDTAALISATCVAMRSSERPVSATSSTPTPTWALESEISPLISLAAPAERCASARTSDATTAKPRPASPARAASTPALSASRLVWKAISSMTPMIWPICCDDLAMALIASTAWRTTAALFLASSSAAATTWRACCVPSADFFTAAVTSVSVAVVCSRLAACCSVRRDRSSAAAEISFALVSIEPVESTTLTMVALSLSTAALKSSRIWA